MKKHSFILLILLFSYCSGPFRNPDTIKVSNQSNSKLVLKKQDTNVSKHRSNGNGSFKKQGIILPVYLYQSYIKLKKFKSDTLKYVQYNFIDNKKKYINKVLNTLLKDLELPVKSYIPGYSYVQENASPVLTLQFYSFDQNSNRIYSKYKPVNIIIEWVTPLPQDSVSFLMVKNKCTWTEAESKFYGKRIIKDIFTTKWKN